MPDAPLILRLQLRVISLNESLNFLSHAQQLGPLFLIERYGEAAQAIDGQRALLADFHGKTFGGGLLQRVILAAQLFNFSSEIFVGPCGVSWVW